jgi:hypothetical protein
VAARFWKAVPHEASAANAVHVLRGDADLAVLILMSASEPDPHKT